MSTDPIMDEIEDADARYEIRPARCPFCHAPGEPHAGRFTYQHADHCRTRRMGIFAARSEVEYLDGVGGRYEPSDYEGER